MIANNKPIRVLVVDDSAVARNLITQGLDQHPRIEVVGTAVNTTDARNKILRLHPDVVTMDVEMPGESGIEFLTKFLPEHPLPVILVSSLNLRVFDALSAGAVDFVRKPDGPHGNAAFLLALAQKILVASCARVPHRLPTQGAAPAPAPLLGRPQGRLPKPTIIGLGASTGGTEATLEVLRRLPADIPGMVIVQHMPVGFTKMYAERLNRLCQMEVREAVHGDEIRPGLALIAPADLQMRVVRLGSRYTYIYSCQPGEKVSGHRPSVDALFSSMASTVQCHMVGIIMTGMGRDGADGLLRMRKAGAYTIGQDRESCVVYGMPCAAMKSVLLLSRRL